MGKPQRTYKRSWKNLLINKPYQLMVTGVLLVSTAVPLVPLGVWVMNKANSATEVAENQVDGLPCDLGELEAAPPPLMIPEPAAAPETADEPGDSATDSAGDSAKDSVPSTASPAGNGADVDVDVEAPSADKGSESPGADGLEALADGGSGEAGTDAAQAAPDGVDGQLIIETDAIVTIIDEDFLEIPAAKSANDFARTAAIARCEAAKSGRITELREGERTIFFVLLCTSILLLFGLAIYSIKMTHKVAGPLFKIGTYLDKLAKDVYAPVYNLRKGDHLVEFFGRFKGGYDGLTDIEMRDIEVLEQTLAYAKDAKLADKSDELTAAIEDLEKVVEQKKAAMAQILDQQEKDRA